MFVLSVTSAEEQTRGPTGPKRQEPSPWQPTAQAPAKLASAGVRLYFQNKKTSESKLIS